MNIGAKSLTAVVLTTVTLLSGCSEGTTDDERLVEANLPLTSVCNDATGLYSVDGIPAYEQCAASTNAAIYSNNGVDTATSALSSDWKRTQYSGGYQCTELVHRYWLFKWNVTWLPDGDAWRWCDTTPPSNSGLTLTTTPVHGDAIVFAQGACGASATYGHVALVDTVDSAGNKVTFVEQNYAGRRATAISCASCFLHVVANTGTAGTGGASGTGGATKATGGTSSVGSTKATGGTSSVGSTKATGGTSSVGSTKATGGTSSVGSTKATGGTSSTGGTKATGGTSNIGGTKATGGTSSVSGAEANGGFAMSVGGDTYSNSTVPNTTTPAGGSSSTFVPLGGNIGAPTSTLASAGQSIVVEGEPEETDAGCTCSAAGHRPLGNGTLWLLALGTVLLRKRRSTHSRG